MHSQIQISDKTARISGVLDHGSVPGLLKELGLQQENYQQLDLSAVSLSNSAGIALLLELIESFESRDSKLTVINMPAQMQRVAELSGVAELLNS